LETGRSQRVPNQGSTVGGGWQPLCDSPENAMRKCETGRCHGEASRSVLAKFGNTSSHVFTQLPQNVAVEPGINSLAFWERCFALPQLLYRWREPVRNILDYDSYLVFVDCRRCLCEGLTLASQGNSSQVILMVWIACGCVPNCLSSSKRRLMQHFRFTKLYCLTPTLYEARRRHPQAVPVLTVDISNASVRLKHLPNRTSQNCCLRMSLKPKLKVRFEYLTVKFLFFILLCYSFVYCDGYKTEQLKVFNDCFYNTRYVWNVTWLFLYFIMPVTYRGMS
jgi:hypothetical protein